MVTLNRHRFLCLPENVSALRDAIRYVMARHPFQIDAFVLLPDHLHCIWTLPEGDSDFSTRWRLVKSAFTRKCDIPQPAALSPSRQHKGEQAVWQRRFWEHQIRDDTDFTRHVEYIHYNPVKHDLVKAPRDWEYPSFHRYAREGIYDQTWGSGTGISFEADIGSE